MRTSEVGAGRRRVGNLLLLVGYPLSSWAGARLVPVVRQRRLGRFLAFEGGTACVVAGLALRRRRFLAVLNGGFLAAAAAWWLSGRRA